MIVVRTNGEAQRAYVGSEEIPVERLEDPIFVALATLRQHCLEDRARIMSEFRWHTHRRTDVFGLRAQTAARAAQESREAWEAERARLAERAQERAAAPPVPKPTDEAKRAKFERAASILGRL